MNDSAVLVAIPDDWRTDVVNHLTGKHLPVLEAASYDEALSFVKTQKVSAVIIVLDWIVSKDGTLTTLWGEIQHKFPVLMLVHPESNYEYMDIYQPPLHDYCHIPFSLSQVESFMKRNGLDANAHKPPLT